MGAVLFAPILLFMFFVLRIMYHFAPQKLKNYIEHLGE